MRKRRKSNFIVSLAALLASVNVPLSWSHHSHGNYSVEFTDIEGVVREVHLVNPHSWIYIDVMTADGPAIWALEAASRNLLDRVGVTSDTLTPGENIKVRCHPLRDGSRGCLLGFVKAADGTITDWDATNLPVPADF